MGVSSPSGSEDAHNTKISVFLCLYIFVVGVLTTAEVVTVLVLGNYVVAKTRL